MNEITKDTELTSKQLMIWRKDWLEKQEKQQKLQEQEKMENFLRSRFLDQIEKGEIVELFEFFVLHSKKA